MNDDLADIKAFMEQAGVRAVAEAVRAHSGELATYQSVRQPEVIRPGRLSPDWWTEHRVPTRQVVATPVEDDTAPSWALPWYQRSSTRIAACIVVALTVLGLVVWAVAAALFAIGAAVSAHSSSIEGIAVLAIVVLLALCCSGRRGGKEFSGTFTGRMH